MTAESENDEQSIKESFRGDLKRLANWVRTKRYVLLIVCLWTAVLSFVIVWEYYSLYEKYPNLWSDYKVAFEPTTSEWIPRLYTIDYVVVLVVSALAGYAIADVEDTLFGLIASGILSILIGVAYSTLFIWYVLGFGSVLGSSGITMIIWAAFLNIFRMVFPIALLFIFLGGIFGSFFRGLVQPSAQD
jgi:hypothetical protein